MDKNKMNNKKNYKEQLIIYSIFAIIVLIGIAFFSGEYMDTKKENQELKQAIIQLQQDYNSQYATMVQGANELYLSLKECRG